MSKILSQIKATRNWIESIEDQRDQDGHLMVFLKPNWFFTDIAGCDVRGFETVAAVRAGTVKAKVIRLDEKVTPTTVEAIMHEKQALQMRLDDVAAVIESHSYEKQYYGMTHCPHCNTHLSNGVGEHLQEVNGIKIKHEQFKFECLACGEEFGPEIRKPAPRHIARLAGPRPAMVESLKLDRRIIDLDTGKEYKNACQVWKSNLVTASQGDRLSAVLYGGAKKGIYEPVKINGHTFTLAAALQAKRAAKRAQRSAAK